MPPPAPLALALALFSAPVFLLGCGGETRATSAPPRDAAPDAFTDAMVAADAADAAIPDDAAASPVCTPGSPGLPQPIRCSSSADHHRPDPDASTLPVPCATAADCGNAGGMLYCLDGECAWDQCLVSSDCPVGMACGCGGLVGGWTNLCVPATCRVDSDCGPGGQCFSSATSTPNACSYLLGYFCQTPADTCEDGGCCAESGSPGEACLYQLQLGHWACAAAPAVCFGP